MQRDKVVQKQAEESMSGESLTPAAGSKMTQTHENNQKMTVHPDDESLPASLPLLADEDDESEELNIEQALKLAAKGEQERLSRSQQQAKTFATFSEAGLNSKLEGAITNLGWHTPTDVQALCLPYTLTGKDVAGFAQTGTGKTGVFLITIAHRIMEMRDKQEGGGRSDTSPFAVIMAPTRELAIQIEEEARCLFDLLSIDTLAIYGGMNWESQAQRVKQGVDVIVATPGRLKDYCDKKFFSFNETKIFVCDEVDRMFDMGFIEDVEYFFAKLSPSCQKLIFSATTNDKVKELAFEYLDKPEYISVHPEELTPDRIEQHALLCETPHKFKIMLSLLKEHQPERAIIFANTKLTAAWLHYKLNRNGMGTDIITGDLPQAKRIRLIQRIKTGDVKVLIATDVASRGLHISGVSHVYNFDIPDEAANYVHRIGRTARAGAKGSAYSLVCDEYASNFLAVQQLLGKDAPKSTWYDPAYLSIEDKAGNPFEDNFGQGVKEASERGERRSHGAHHQTGAASKPRRIDKFERPERHKPTNKKYQPRSRQQSAGMHKERQRQQPRHEGRRTPQQQTTRSFSGMLKRVFTLLFSWAKKK